MLSKIAEWWNSLEDSDLIPVEEPQYRIVRIAGKFCAQYKGDLDIWWCLSADGTCGVSHSRAVSWPDYCLVDTEEAAGERINLNYQNVFGNDVIWESSRGR